MLSIPAPEQGTMSAHSIASSQDFRAASPVIGVKAKLSRPKSVPPSLRPPSEMSVASARGRPKTAGGISNMATDCDRVSQVGREPTRKHNLEAHLPLRKAKPQPWQRHLDSQPVPVVTAPGYILSKSKTKIEVLLKTDEFFEQQQKEPYGRRSDPERDGLIAQLQQQIDDLTLFLEEERLNHRDTKRKAEEQLKDRIDELTNEHANQLKMLEEEHLEDMENMKMRYEQELQDQRLQSENIVSKMRGEIEFLQGAFESYKSQLHKETDDKWKKLEDDMRFKYEADIEEQLHQLRSRLIAEKNHEKAEISKEHLKEIQAQRKEHKKEMDSLLRRFSNAAADLKRLKETEERLVKTDKELSELQQNYDKVCVQLTDVTRELTDTKVQLIGYEKHFQDKVQEIDDKYKGQLDDLRQQNSQLRMLYVKKCGELFDEKGESEKARIEQLESAKETMKELEEISEERISGVEEKPEENFGPKAVQKEIWKEIKRRLITLDWDQGSDGDHNMHGNHFTNSHPQKSSRKHGGQRPKAR